ncbi:MAG: hypothetical protein U0903_12165 [Planctomycetales bacterium]
MIAFEVKLNGTRVCLAGAADLRVLSAHVTASGKLGKKTVSSYSEEQYDAFYSVGGLTSRKAPTTDVHVRWKSTAPLQLGDVIEVQIMDVTKADRPKSRKKATKSPKKPK